METLRSIDFATLLATAKPGLSFNEDMMRALLAGTKTQTRRPMKPQPPGWVERFADANVGGPWFDGWTFGRKETYRIKAPYQPGGVYYARETFLVNKERPCGFEYRADWCDELADEAKWTPAIHFPRRAARCIYRIDDVFPQRVQEITDTDAIAEGVDRTNTSIPGYAKTRFRILWNSIYANEFPWESNPFVWVYKLTLLATREG